ncbi:hypothetical protein [Aeoliella mucimassa]|uniref:Phage-related minor tail protein n=1 Tax=Aeoliella mucimassa TaxID=2527972 RepID=A0A518ARN9_9BACT|nr:hypothetical protein [Aeoliella mucimassa]QDU57382.1 hypothetical protein Pan181_35970 [Aeoliella mucimassa]
MGTKFELQGSGRGAVELIRQLNAELDKSEQQGADAAKGLAKLKSEAERFAATGDKVEQYNHKLARLAHYVEKGALEQGKAEAAANRWRQQLDRLDPKLREAAESERKLAAESERVKQALRQQGETLRQSLETPQESFNRQLRETIKLHRADAISVETRRRRIAQLRGELHAATSATKGMFSKQVLSGLAAGVTGLLGVGSAASTAMQALRQMEQTAQSASSAVVESLGSLGELQQVSDSPEDYLANLGVAREAVKRGIFENYSQGGDFAIAVKNAGYSKEDVRALLDIGESRQIAGDKLIEFGKSASKVGNLYDGRYSLREIADRVSVSSKETQVSAAETAQASTKFGQQSRELKFTGDSSMAALAVLEKQAGNIDQAGTQLGALYNSLLRRGLAKGTLVETLDSIQSQVDAGSTAINVLGESNAAMAFSALQNDREGFARIRSNLANADGYLDARRFMEVDPSVSAANMVPGSAGRLKDAALRYGDIESASEAAANDIEAAWLRRGHQTMAAIGRGVTNTQDSLGYDRSIVLGAARNEYIGIENRLGYAKFLQSTPGNANEAIILQRLIPLLEEQLEVQKRSLGIQEQKENSNTSEPAGGTTKQEN